VAVILEATAQLLERDGLEGFTTNAVAERAGVSIGAIYRYFPNKRALMLALAERESALHGEEMQRLLQANGSGLAPDRALVRAFIGAFKGRTRARRIAMGVWFEMTPAEALARRLDAFTQILNQTHETIEPINAFVLTRATTAPCARRCWKGSISSTIKSSRTNWSPCRGPISPRFAPAPPVRTRPDCAEASHHIAGGGVE